MGRFVSRFFGSALWVWGLLAVAGCASLYSTGTQEERTSLRNLERIASEIQTRSLPKLDEHSDLSDYLTYADLNNPGLESAFHRWKAALERIPQERALADPQLTYQYFIERMDTRQAVSLTQAFPWFGKLDAQGRIALEEAGAEEKRYEAARLRLHYQVKNAYYEYYYVHRAIDVATDNLELIGYLESVAQTRYTAGLGSYADIIRVQLELGKLEDALRSLKDLARPVLAQLNSALNRKPDAPLPPPRSIPYEQIRASEEQILKWLKESNPELEAIDLMALRERRSIDLAGRNYFPDIMLGVEYEDSVMRGEDAVSTMISVNLPVWRDRYRAGEREAEARYASVGKEREERENSLLADLKMNLYNLRDAERKIDLYANTLIPKAGESLEVTLQGLETDVWTFLEVIDAQRSLLEFELEYERALANHAQRLAELEMLVGREIPKVRTKVESRNDSKTPANREGKSE